MRSLTIPLQSNCLNLSQILIKYAYCHLVLNFNVLAYRVTTELLPGYKISQQIRADFIAHSYYVLNLPFRTWTFPYMSNCSWLPLCQSTPRMFTYNVVCGFPQAIIPYLYKIQIYLDSPHPQLNPGV